MTVSIRPPRPVVPEEVVIGYQTEMSNWGRWGADDTLGTLNLVTPEKVRDAIGLVADGVSVSCSRLLEFAPKPQPPEVTGIPPTHMMHTSGETAPPGRMFGGNDWFSMPVHSLYVTHIDAHAHLFWNGQMYNGQPAHAVRTASGATKGGVDLAASGVLTRGILLDVPRAIGVDWLEDGDAATEADLIAAEQMAGLTVSAGDLLFVRTGYGARRPTDSPDLPGLNPDCLPFLRSREPAIVATDTGTDAYPSPYETMIGPVHCVCIVAMGMWVIDNCDLEALSRECAARNRWEFLAVVAPLRLKNTTGSPLNPIAVF